MSSPFNFVAARLRIASPTMPSSFPSLRVLALAAALVASSAGAQTVTVTAQDASAAPSGMAFVDIQFDFTGTYRLLAVDLSVDYDASQLAWDQAATTLTILGGTDTLDNVLAYVNANLIAIATSSSSSGNFALAATPFNPPPLNGVLTLHAAFNLLPPMTAGTSSLLSISGHVSEDTTGIETAFSTSATVSAVPEPTAAWLLAAGLAGLGALAYRRPRRAGPVPA